MEVFFKPTFVKELNSLPKATNKETRKLCLETFSKLQNLKELKNCDLKPINGFKGYYRIKIGDYGVGFKTESKAVIFMRVCHRKNIYRHFP